MECVSSPALFLFVIVIHDFLDMSDSNSHNPRLGEEFVFEDPIHKVFKDDM